MTTQTTALILIILGIIVFLRATFFTNDKRKRNPALYLTAVLVAMGAVLLFFAK